MGDQVGGGSSDARRGEARLPASVATVVAAALYALLPDKLIVHPRLLIPLLELVLLGVLVIANPVRMNRQTRWSRRTALGLIVLVGVTNLAALVLLLRKLVTDRGHGPVLLLAAGQVWLTNVIVYGPGLLETRPQGPGHPHPRGTSATAVI